MEIRYETKEVVHCWSYDEAGDIYTHVELYLKIIPGNPNSWESPEDYYGYTQVLDYEVIKVTNEFNAEITIYDTILEDNAKREYFASLSEFITNNTKLYES